MPACWAVRRMMPRAWPTVMAVVTLRFKKELLDADDVGLIFPIEFIEAVKEHDQPFGIGMVRRRLDGPIRHRLQAAAVGVDDTKTADSRPRVDSHCPHLHCLPCLPYIP